MRVSPYLGEIAIWTSNWAPIGWALCDDSIINAAANSAILLSLLGNRYGGDGSSNFALPDLRTDGG